MIGKKVKLFCLLALLFVAVSSVVYSLVHETKTKVALKHCWRRGRTQTGNIESKYQWLLENAGHHKKLQIQTWIVTILQKKNPLEIPTFLAISLNGFAHFLKSYFGRLYS